MKLISLLVISLIGVSTGFTAAAGEFYGETFKKQDQVKVDALMSKPTTFSKKTIVVEGEISKVCKKKGCWFEFATKGEPLKVTFKDYGFTIPKDSKDSKVVAKGQLVEKTVSVAHQKHYLKDEGASKEEIAKIKEPKKTYEFIAEGVYL